MLTRRGLLAGLLALPVVRVLAPLAKAPVPIETPPVEYGHVVVPHYFDLNDSEVVNAWSRELSRAMAQSIPSIPLTDKRFGMISFTGTAPIRLVDRSAGTGA